MIRCGGHRPSLTMKGRTERGARAALHSHSVSPRAAGARISDRGRRRLYTGLRCSHVGGSRENGCRPATVVSRRGQIGAFAPHLKPLETATRGHIPRSRAMNCKTIAAVTDFGHRMPIHNPEKHRLSLPESLQGHSHVSPIRDSARRLCARNCQISSSYSADWQQRVTVARLSLRYFK